jgi:GTP diphosphokinase / guanosine-3',5'-bis(diphosphate) 3'-diphosphatase
MFSENEKAVITDKHIALIERLSSGCTQEELKKINLAFEWASKTYNGQRLGSGKPYILHLIELAHIAVDEIGLGTTSVIAAFLHGINLKSDFSLGMIEEKFGSGVRLIVDGFNRVSQMRTERLSFQSDSFRKLFLTLIDDIRVILLKIAHRLYDLRNPDDVASEKLKPFMQEVKHLYIPIAHRLGLYNIKAEFEEKVMMYENPEIFQGINEQIKATKKKQEVFIQDFLAPIERELLAQGLDCSVKWRTKSIPSIYAKMKAQNLDFDQVYDIFAVRIITKSKPKKEKEDCWRVYSIVTDIYQPNPKRLRDWITTPKASGYESLHTTVKSMGDRWVEVQIRSERMDEIAERGQAAHWRYKGTDKKRDMEDWLNQVRDVLENPDQINFDQTNRNKPKPKNEKIFIFTPNGDLKQLPEGSTVLDFAYEVHTKVGETCSGAKVNNKNVPIRYQLQNGDKVEIITSKKQYPKQDWLGFVVTERARSKIKKFVREEDLRESEAGKELLVRKLKNWKIPYNDQGINYLVKTFKTDTAIELYHQLATEKIDLQDIKKCLLEFAELDKERQAARANKTEDKISFKMPGQGEEKSNDDFLIIDQSLKNVNFKLAKCCNPIPGDSVFGFVTIGSGITIHRVNCPNASRLVERYSYRVMKVRWRGESDNPVFNAAIRVQGKDLLGLVGEITKVISNDLKVNMRSISFDTRDGMFNGSIQLQIKDVENLEQLMHKLLKVNGVEKVSRLK